VLSRIIEKIIFNGEREYGWNENGFKGMKRNIIKNIRLTVVVKKA